MAKEAEAYFPEIKIFKLIIPEKPAKNGMRYINIMSYYQGAKITFQLWDDEREGKYCPYKRFMAALQKEEQLKRVNPAKMKLALDDQALALGDVILTDSTALSIKATLRAIPIGTDRAIAYKVTDWDYTNTYEARKMILLEQYKSSNEKSVEKMIDNLSEYE